MSVPQPFQYQGSKRRLAPVILSHFPVQVGRFVEPFAGSGALSVALATEGRASQFWLNDLNQPLAQLLQLMIDQPEGLADHYEDAWQGAVTAGSEHYYAVREAFNRAPDPRLLLYLLTRCVKGAVRYNSAGLFNQSPDRRRCGVKPATMRANLRTFSALLRGRSRVTACDYRQVLDEARGEDLIYLDPPYQGVCGVRDARYWSRVASDDLVAALDELNRRGRRYALSYDGRLGEQSYGEPLPAFLNLTVIEIEAGRSAQATLSGRQERTRESLYLSPRLAAEIGIDRDKISPLRSVSRNATAQRVSSRRFSRAPGGAGTAATALLS